MKKFIILAMVGLAVACTSSKHSTGAATGSGGGSAGSASVSSAQDGSSYENAVVIQEKSETKGVDVR